MKNAKTMNAKIKWAARLSHVKQVSLLGTADLAYWKDRLRAEGLLPIENDGQAQILIIAAEARFKGIRFREVSFSAQVTRADDEARQPAAYLFRAYVSNRFFAFCERAFFTTPYDHGDVRLTSGIPAAIRLARRGEAAFGAEMSPVQPAASREHSSRGEENWDGAVFLPKSWRGQGRLFLARIRGEARTFPFLPGEDSIAINAKPGIGAPRQLLESRFTPRQWSVLDDAAHDKSVTYQSWDILTR